MLFLKWDGSNKPLSSLENIESVQSALLDRVYMRAHTYACNVDL